MKIAACSKTFGTRKVLSCPELEFGAGRICAIVGPNGSGKSTYARLAAGVLTPDSGGRILESNTVVRYMPQKSYPFRMTVEKNICLFGGDQKRAEMLMEALSLTHVRHQRARALSGGETAKLSLARVLMEPCELLILDEPTAAMDMESTIAAEKLVDTYRKDVGCAVLLVLHDLAQAKRMADDALFFLQGELCEKGEAKDLFVHPKKQETRRFLEFYGVS